MSFFLGVSDCVINVQIVVENKLTLCEAVIQRVHYSRPNSFDRAEIYSQQLATRDLIHCNLPLSNFLHAAISVQVAKRFDIHFYAQVLKTERITLISDLCFVRVELVQLPVTLQSLPILLPLN